MLAEPKPQSALQHQQLVLEALMYLTPGANSPSNEHLEWSSWTLLSLEKRRLTELLACDHHHEQQLLSALTSFTE